MNQKGSTEETGMMMQEEFITLIENHERGRIEAHIKGIFPPPSVVSRELSAMHNLSDKYGTIAFFINSPGGSISTLIEVINIAKKYGTVITINCGECASAGFFLWVVGDVRVVCEHSVFMAHRESYRYQGKTALHLDVATFNNKQYNHMMEQYFGDILTDEEFEHAKIKEIFISDKDILERGIGITWDKFNERENAVHNAHAILNIEGIPFMLDPETNTMAQVIRMEFGETVAASDVLYNSEFMTKEEYDEMMENGEFDTDEDPDEFKPDNEMVDERVGHKKIDVEKIENFEEEDEDFQTYDDILEKRRRKVRKSIDEV